MLFKGCGIESDSKQQDPNVLFNGQINEAAGLELMETDSMQCSTQKRLESIAWRVIQTRIFNRLRPKVCHLPFFYLEGKTKRSFCSFSALVFGQKEFANYFSKISYSEEPETRYLGKTSLSSIRSIVTDAKPDVVVVCASNLFSEFLLSEDFFILPYVGFSLGISDSWDSILSRMHRSKQRMIRRIEKTGYSYETTKEYEKLTQLYHEMYVPSVSRKHGKSAEIVSFAECERLFKKGGLFLVRLDGKPVSDAIYVPQGNELYIPVLNTNQVDQQRATDANCAALYFLILWAKQKGYTRIDYGSCKPFLNDGAFQYKKEWGMEANLINKSDARILAMKFCNFDQGARDFLLANPFVFVDETELKGLTIFSSTDDLQRGHHVQGLSNLIVLCSAHDSSLLQQKYRSVLQVDSEQGRFLRFLVELASRNGYCVYGLKF